MCLFHERTIAIFVQQPAKCVVFSFQRLFDKRKRCAPLGPVAHRVFRATATASGMETTTHSKWQRAIQTVQIKTYRTAQIDSKPIHPSVRSFRVLNTNTNANIHEWTTRSTNVCVWKCAQRTWKPAIINTL